MSQFKLPDLSQRVAVIGRTGSGKTQMGIFLLSLARFDKIPFIIFDFKGDELIDEIGATDISIYENPPKKAGLYRVQPIPEVDDEAVDAFLWKVWQNGNTGLFFDEGYMVADSKAYSAIMTQGRSLRIPCITNTQRPVWANPFTFSEADFFCVFQLNKKDDNKKISEFAGDEDFRQTLPPYYARWYDVKQAKLFTLQPAPSADIIINSFKEKIKPNFRIT